ncbi:hypothetical protein KC339_g81 [Hortaea werneckii]|nr:hypothetical protein KC339_g81 [Hortaea werneckii]
MVAGQVKIWSSAEARPCSFMGSHTASSSTPMPSMRSMNLTASRQPALVKAALDSVSGTGVTWIPLGARIMSECPEVRFLLKGVRLSEPVHNRSFAGLSRKHPAERTNAHCSACFVQSDGHGALNSVKKYASHVVPSQARFESKRIERVFLFLPQLFRLIGECGPDIVVKLPENPHLLLARGTQGTLATQRRNRALDVVFVVGIVNMAFQGLQPVRHLHIAFAVLQEIHLLSVPSLSWNRSVV